MGENDQNSTENPWESASNDQTFREQAASQASGAPQTSGEPSTPGVTSVRWDIDENHNSSNAANDVSFLTSETATESNGRRRGPLASCSNCLSKCSSKCSLSYFLHVWDIVLTTLWTTFVVYHLCYNKANESSRSAHMDILIVLCIVLAVFNALRGFVWIWASLPSLSTICCFGCCFVDDSPDSNGMTAVSKLAAFLTMWLGIMYGSVSLAAWFGHSSWLPWCEGLGSWCSELIHTQTVMSVALTVASVIELLRWIFFKGQLSSSSSTSAGRTRSPDYYNDDFSSLPSENSRNRPWWISRRANDRNDGLNEPLLDSGGQPSWTTTSWMPFSSRSRGSSNSNNNGTNGIINGDEEDVESVLDSLGEDWTSRAESDPYWWTR